MSADPAIAVPPRSRRVWSLLLPLLAATAFFALYFSPAGLSSHFLAPGDGIIQYIPSLTRPWALWSDLLGAGYPVAADLQSMAFYPPARLLGSFNLIVISAYVIAATGMYALAFAVTGSRMAAAFAGLILASGGFMIAHLGHFTIIHAAAWAPWLLWSVRAIFRERLLAGAVALAASTFMVITAGHPQIALYAATLAGAYGLLQASQAQRSLQKLVVAFAAGMLGVALAAVSILPFIELAGASVRQAWSLTEFGSYSLTPPTLILHLFPNLFGTAPPYIPYFGPWNSTELIVYSGIAPLVLATLALASTQRRETFFWIGVAVVALTLSLGTSTPLGRLVYELPAYGMFRSQGRFGLLLTVAVAMLAALGVARASAGPLPPVARWLPWIFGAAMLGAGMVVLWQYDALVAVGATVGRTLPSWHENPAVLVPMVLAAAAVALACVLTRSVAGSVLLWLALALCAVDLASFGWFFEWRSGNTPKALLHANEWQPLIRDMRRSENRIAPIGGYTLGSLPVAPNLSSHFGLSNVGVYGPLMLSRYARYSGADSGGNVQDFERDAPIWDVLAVGWIAGADGDPLALGSDCGGRFGRPHRLHARFASPGVTGIRIVSSLACATTVEQGRVVGEISLSPGSAGLPIQAGVHASEWAIDRPDVAKQARHARAPVHSSFGVASDIGHWYVAEFPLADPVDVESVAIEVRPGVMWQVNAVELLRGDGTSSAIPLATFRRETTGSWRGAVAPGPLASLERREDLLPRAWLVHAAVSATEGEVRNALTIGDLPDGQRWDPYAVALLDAPATGFDARAAVPRPGSVEVLERGEGRWRLRVQSPGEAMLVISQAYYPGWRAKVGGTPVEVVPVDGLIQGVQVRPGSHDVELTYMPRSFIAGAAISLGALAVFLALCVRLWAGRGVRA